MEIYHRLATTTSIMDDIDEIDESHPESTDAFAAYIAEGGINDKDRQELMIVVI